MGGAVHGRELGPKIVRSLGLPVEDCLGAELHTPAGDIAEVVVRYKLMPEALAKLVIELAGPEAG